MHDIIKKRLYPRNPLGIIALFVFFIEAISTVSLKFMLENKSYFVGHIVWFVILFPSIIVLLFFATLWWRREGLYGPGDFRDDSSFVGLLQKKVEDLELRQEASQLDPDDAIDVFMKTIEKLVKREDVLTAVQVGRSALKESRYENSLQIFKYLGENVPKSHGFYYRILANLAYSLIGLGRFEEAIGHLLEVRTLREGKPFYVWHALALAYSYLKTGNSDEYKRWVKYAKGRPEYSGNLRLMMKLYPEMKDDLTAP